MPQKPVYYQYDTKMRSKVRMRNAIITIVSLVLMIAGVYILVLTQSANLPIASPIDLNTSDDKNDPRNRIQIEKMNIEVPYFGEKTAAALEKGAWWRFPDRGNPQKGGNFILSAHRFYLGATPAGTKTRSPFYKLDKLNSGDKIRVFYEGKWYDYQVAKKYSVKPNATEIENKSVEAKLTLYTCSLRGSADGRVVIEAAPISH